MKVPLLDLPAQLAQNGDLGQRILGSVAAVLSSGRYIGGPKVAALEKVLAEDLGVAHAIGVSSGTDALLVALMALEVGPGDLVLVPDFSFFATAGCVARLGATPVFIDIEGDSFNLDPVALKTWLTENAADYHRVKAIVPVHLFGQCADMDAIREAAGDIPLVEDAAQAIGATYKGRAAGSMGAVGCFSFFPSKNLGAAGDGGLVVTNDDALAERIRRLKAHGAKPKYHHALIGGNFRLDPIQAVILLEKRPHLADWNELRREHATFYDEAIAEAGLEPDLATPVRKWDEKSHVFNQYTVKVCGNRDALKAHLAERGIGSEIYYPVPFHRQKCFAHLDAPTCRTSAVAAGCVLSLPVYPELTEDMQRTVVEALAEFFEKSDGAEA